MMERLWCVKTRPVYLSSPYPKKDSWHRYFRYFLRRPLVASKTGGNRGEDIPSHTRIERSALWFHLRYLACHVGEGSERNNVRCRALRAWPLLVFDGLRSGCHIVLLRSRGWSGRRSQRPGDSRNRLGGHSPGGVSGRRSRVVLRATRRCITAHATEVTSSCDRSCMVGSPSSFVWRRRCRRYAYDPEAILDRTPRNPWVDRDPINSNLRIVHAMVLGLERDSWPPSSLRGVRHTQWQAALFFWRGQGSSAKPWAARNGLGRCLQPTPSGRAWSRKLSRRGIVSSGGRGWSCFLG